MSVFGTQLYGGEILICDDRLPMGQSTTSFSPDVLLCTESCFWGHPVSFLWLLSPFDWGWEKC